MTYGSLIRKTCAEQYRRREALRRQTLNAVFEALAALAERVPFDSAFVFGSVTRPGAFTAASDIDIGFVNLNDEVFFRTSAFLSRQLGREVDVIQLEQAGRVQHTIFSEGIRWTTRA
jgi:uncharacterized protein